MRRVGVARQRRLGRFGNFLEHQQWRRLGRVGDRANPHFANQWQRCPPCQVQPLAEMRADPIGHELAWHQDRQLARVGIERPDFGGLQPAVEGARAKITAKPLANRFPSGVERRGHCLPGMIQPIFATLHRPSPHLYPDTVRPSRRMQFTALDSLFFCAPRRRFAPGRKVLRPADPAFKQVFSTK